MEASARQGVSSLVRHKHALAQSRMASGLASTHGASSSEAENFEKKSPTWLLLTLPEKQQMWLVTPGREAVSVRTLWWLTIGLISSGGRRGSEATDPPVTVLRRPQPVSVSSCQRLLETTPLPHSWAKPHIVLGLFFSEAADARTARALGLAAQLIFASRNFPSPCCMGPAPGHIVAWLGGSVPPS